MLSASAGTADIAPRYYNIREVCAMFKVSKSTIYNWIDTNGFPEGTPFSTRCRRWSEDELKAYENSRANGTESAQGRKAVKDRKRAAHLGGASTGKRAKEFWDEVFDLQFRPSALSPEEFATRNCQESSETPIERTYQNGSVRAFRYETILGEMNKRLRE